jgi:hypothetical protein
MLMQYVKFWTLGWDKDGNLVHLPVLTRKQVVSADNEPLRMGYVDDQPDVVAKDRNCVLLLLDTKEFDLDEWGNRNFGDWQIVNQVVKASDPSCLRSVFDEIDKRKEKVEGLLPGLSL